MSDSALFKLFGGGGPDHERRRADGSLRPHTKHVRHARAIDRVRQKAEAECRRMAGQRRLVTARIGMQERMMQAALKRNDEARAMEHARDIAALRTKLSQLHAAEKPIRQTEQTATTLHYHIVRNALTSEMLDTVDDLNASMGGARGAALMQRDALRRGTLLSTVNDAYMEAGQELHDAVDESEEEEYVDEAARERKARELVDGEEASMVVGNSADPYVILEYAKTRQQLATCEKLSTLPRPPVDQSDMNERIAMYLKRIDDA